MSDSPEMRPDAPEPVSLDKIFDGVAADLAKKAAEAQDLYILIARETGRDDDGNMGISLTPVAYDLTKQNHDQSVAKIIPSEQAGTLEEFMDKVRVGVDSLVVNMTEHSVGMGYTETQAFGRVIAELQKLPVEVCHNIVASIVTSLMGMDLEDAGADPNQA